MTKPIKSIFLVVLLALPLAFAGGCSSEEPADTSKVVPKSQAPSMEGNEGVGQTKKTATDQSATAP